MEMLDRAKVIDALRYSASMDHQARVAAQSLLEGYEALPNFLMILLEAVFQKSDEQLRLLSSIYLKNVMQKIWKRNLTDEEKAVFRTRALDLLAETHPLKIGSHIFSQVGTQTALIVSNVLLLDDSPFWVSDLQMVIAAIRDDARGLMDSYRGLCAIYYFLKRLRAAHSDGAQAAQHETIRSHWKEVMAPISMMLSEQISNFNLILNTLAEFGAGNVGVDRLAELVPVAQICQVIFKIMRILIAPSLEMGFTTANLGDIIEKTIRYVHQISAAQSLPVAHPLRPFLERYQVIGMKLLNEAQEAKPLLFLPWLVELLQTTINTAVADQQRFSSARFTILCMVFVRQVLETPEYRASHCQQQLNGVFQPQVVQQLATVCITRYLLLTEEDLQMWQNEPEEFFMEDIRCPWERKFRFCAELVIGSLVRHFASTTGPLIAQLFLSMPALAGRIQLTKQEMLTKEAIYGTIAQAATHLSDYVNPKQVAAAVRADLAADTAAAASHAPVRRRIAGVLETWGLLQGFGHVSDTLGMIIVLMRDTNIIVRMSGLVALKILIDSPTCTLSTFEPFAAASIDLLFEIDKASGGGDAYIQVLFVLSKVIEKLGKKIQPFAPKIIAGLTELWNTNDRKQIGKGAILNTLSDLVGTMRGAPELYPVLIPLIRHSTNGNSPESVHTLDEGLNLWHKTVQRAPVCAEELCSLFPSILVSVAAKDLSPPIAKTLCRLSEDYLLLLMASTSTTLALDSVFSTTVQLLDMLMAQGNTGTPALRTLLLITQLLPMITGGQLPGPPLSDALNTLLERILFRVVVFTSQETDTTLSFFLSVFARLALHMRPYFEAFFGQMEAKAPGKGLLSQLLTIWIDKFHVIETPKQLKLNVMALCSLMSNVTISSEQHIQKIVQLCLTLSPKLTLLCPKPDDALMSLVIRDDMSIVEAQERKLERVDPVTVVDISQIQQEAQRVAGLQGIATAAIVSDLAGMSIQQ